MAIILLCGQFKLKLAGSFNPHEVQRPGLVQPTGLENFFQTPSRVRVNPIIIIVKVSESQLAAFLYDTLSAPFRLKLGRDFFSEDEPKPPQSLRKVDAPRDLVVGRLVNFVTQEALILLNFFHHLSGFLSQPLTNISLSGRRSPLRCFLGGGGLSPQAPSFWGMATGQHKECHGEMRVFKIMRATKLQTLSKKPPVLKTVVVPLRTPTPYSPPPMFFLPLFDSFLTLPARKS